MGIDNLYLFIAAGLLLNLTPGPDVLYIVANGLRSARAGVVAALGITAGCFVHIAAAALGVSALIAASAAAFTLLKWLGAAYLVYVGLSMLWSRRKINAIKNIAVCACQTGNVPIISSKTGLDNDLDSLQSVFKRGFWTNALNPKVALFFLAFLPQFIAHDAPHKTLTFALLGLIFNVNALPINLAYGLGAAWVSKRFAGRGQNKARAAAWLERGAGALFVYFGIRLALADNRA
jgi:threonine/homoserine/homoserine lactone efflux protein